MDTATSLVFRLARSVAWGSGSVATRWFGLAILLVSVVLSASLSSDRLPEIEPLRW